MPSAQKAGGGDLLTAACRSDNAIIVGAYGEKKEELDVLTALSHGRKYMAGLRRVDERQLSRNTLPGPL